MSPGTLKGEDSTKMQGRTGARSGEGKELGRRAQRSVTSGGASLGRCDLSGEPWTSIGQEQEA